MTRQARIDFPGALQNVGVHGVHGQDMFLDDIDRHYRLELLLFVIETCGWIVIAFVFMDNHEHVFVLTPRGNLSDRLLVFF